ncbi:hypothetical protein [Shewanella sp.]|nr:hypothetical protein [Shewanella sp.]
MASLRREFGILPLLLRMLVEKDGCSTNFLEGYAKMEVDKLLN